MKLGEAKTDKKQIEIDLTWTSLAPFLTRETVPHSVTYRSNFAFRNLSWSLHFCPLIIPVKTGTFQLQTPFKWENISEYLVVTQTKTSLGLYLVFIS